MTYVACEEEARHPSAVPRGPWWWLWLEPGTGCERRPRIPSGRVARRARAVAPRSGCHGGLARRARGSRAFRTFVPQYVYARDSVSPRTASACARLAVAREERVPWLHAFALTRPDYGERSLVRRSANPSAIHDRPLLSDENLIHPSVSGLRNPFDYVHCSHACCVRCFCEDNIY
jgi:hypothetical protein